MFKIQSLSKHYPGVRALHNVSLSLEPGQIHGLVGENGAGKSTLIQILAGVNQPQAGDIHIDGECVRIDSPKTARQNGIGVLHQHTHLIPDLTVAENGALRLGYPTTRTGRIHWKSLTAQAETAIADLLPSLDISTPAGNLSGIEKQLVELAFALATKPRLLILDEPTAILPRRETDLLFDSVKLFAKQGGAVLFVSHRLDEIFQITEQVSVLRDGEKIWTKPTSTIDQETLIEAMIGRAVRFNRTTENMENTQVLHIDQLTVPNHINNVSFDLQRGEILGLYGLVGAGQPELCQALFGLNKHATGIVKLGAHDLSNLTPQARVEQGLAYVPADRLTQGMFHLMDVGQNMSMAALPHLSERWGINLKKESTDNDAMIETLDIRTTGASQTVSALSGGNQQKVLLGRWLQTSPSVLILEEPTQGVDVGSKDEIYDHIRRLAANGTAILLISTDLPELMALSHQIGILREGALVAKLDANTTTEADVLREALPQSTEAEIKSNLPTKNENKLRTQWFNTYRETGLTLFVLFMIGMASFLSPAFATTDNMRDLLVNNAILFIGAIGIGMVIISGAIDISIGAVLGLSAVTAGLLDQAGASPILIAGGAVLTGCILGVVNGTITVLGGVHSIVVTLGTMSIFRAGILQLTGGKWLLHLSPQVTGFSNSVMGIPLLILVGIGVAILSHIFLQHTKKGRDFYALGGNTEHAAYLGIVPRQILPIAFGICGLLMGIAGLLQAARYGQVQTNVGIGFELRAIAAAVIGGTHIMGGRGSVLGIFLGALVMGLLANLLVLLHISTFWEGVVIGLVILMVVVLDTVVTRRQD